MNTKLSRQMTFLGLGVLVFYAGLLGTGQASIEILPQFAISAIIFLSSGKIMRQIAAKLPAKETEGEEEQKEPNWELRTQILNWVAAGAVLSIVAVFIAKPVTMSFPEFFEFIVYHSNYNPEMNVPLAP